MSNPIRGGHYVRDPKTGALSRADETMPPAAQPEAEKSEIQTEAVTPASIKKGK